MIILKDDQNNEYYLIPRGNDFETYKIVTSNGNIKYHKHMNNGYTDREQKARQNSSNDSSGSYSDGNGY